MSSEQSKTSEFQNKLKDESSPYLLQHATNPVLWKPWSENALKQAKVEEKLVVVSIGYSTCHWCHVMAHESFEDESVAELMNRYFVNIKVDREERPDVDKIYMTAVQLMRQQGGWPLNVICLPDGRPIWGGTYFKKEAWKGALMQLVEVYKSEPEKVYEYAEKLQEGIVLSEQIVKADLPESFEDGMLHSMVEKWSKQFDDTFGGLDFAPKFPMPNNYLFLLRYAHTFSKEAIKDHVNLTLTKMALCGIYDQVGGGFTRYSTDSYWKVPHFEKMLYDNGQLLSLYAEVYSATKTPLYKQVVEQTCAFMLRELYSNEHLFCSALDADSEGVEGKFYCWDATELEDILGNDFGWVSKYYNINEQGYWENSMYILLRQDTDENVAKEIGWTIEELRTNVNRINTLLLAERSKRVRPGLDDKIITSWNAMAIKGFADAGFYLQNQNYIKVAEQTMHALLEKVCNNDFSLKRIYKEGNTAKIEAYLDDYACVIKACLTLYQTTLKEDWLKKAEQLTSFVQSHFFNSKNNLFYYSVKEEKALMTRSCEVGDNVIPASNSIMANNLLVLGVLTENEQYVTMAEKMLASVYDVMVDYGSGYSNWGILQLMLSKHRIEIGATGADVNETLQLLAKNVYVSNSMRYGTTASTSALPLLKDKPLAEKAIYICKQNTCYNSVVNVQEASSIIRNL